MHFFTTFFTVTAGLSTASAFVVPRSSTSHIKDVTGLKARQAACPAPAAAGKAGAFWLDQMDHTGAGRGVAPHAGDANYAVYRNVVTGYGAKSDGSVDASAALNKAISDGSRAGSVTTKPAQVFLPGGKYKLSSAVNLLMGTIVMGDPNDPPVLIADAGFAGDTLVNGYDKNAGHAETSFFTQLRNVVLDTTAVPAGHSLTALQWGVAQACAVGNVQINMPTGGSSHVGMDLKGGSTVAVTDMKITGGSIGIRNTNQQVNFKNIAFSKCTTAYMAKGGWTSLLQSVTFDQCGFCIDMTQGNAGDVVLLDSTATNSGTVIEFTDSSKASGDRNNQVVIENLKHDGPSAIAVASGKTVLPATSTVDTWVWGNAQPGQYQTGVKDSTPRPKALLNAQGQFFTMQAPTFAGYSKADIVNVKTVDKHAVHGDGKTDDAAALNAILAANAAACKVSYFPYGVYIVQDTLVIPPNSRIMGEAWPVISGAGAKFQDAKKPLAVVQVGAPGSVGVAQISDLRFAVADVLPGAKIVEVNMAGSAPGDVGLWNVAVTIGGTADTKVSTACTSQDPTSCMAAHTAIHLTKSSSAYLQNVWVWTADHNLDGGPVQIISAGRGVLVEATRATWLVGTASEHNWLYNFNLNGAANVFAGMQQTESPYMQGAGAAKLAPAPWAADAAFGDPDFSWCGGGDAKCRSSLAQNIQGGADLFLYSSANWAFFNGPWDGKYDSGCKGSCQTNMNRVAGAPKRLAWYAVNTKSADVMILDAGATATALQAYNPGSWGGNLAAYRAFA